MADPKKPDPGAVFVRPCPGCGTLVQTADPTGGEACEACAAKPLPVDRKKAARTNEPTSTPQADVDVKSGR